MLAMFPRTILDTRAGGSAGFSGTAEPGLVRSTIAVMKRSLGMAEHPNPYSVCSNHKDQRAVLASLYAH